MTTFEQPEASLPPHDAEWGLHTAPRRAPGVPREPSRAWFLGERTLPCPEPSDPAALELMRCEAAELPLLLALRRALDLIGDGLKVKASGCPYARDIREFARRQGEPAHWRDASSLPGFTELVDVLSALGWVEIEDRLLRQVEGAPAEDVLDPEAERHLDAVRDVIREAVRVALRKPWWLMDASHERTLRDALLIATTDEGLLLPWAPRQISLHHCRDSTLYLVDLLAHPWIRDIPLDAAGHVPSDVLAELAACHEGCTAWWAGGW